MNLMQKISTLLVPTNLKNLAFNIIYSWTFVLFILFFERFFFFILYYPEIANQEEISFFNILESFIYGIRFDIAVLPIFLFFYHLFLIIFFFIYSSTKLSFNLYKRICFLLFFIEWYFILHLSISNIASILNYAVNNKHLGWEYFAYFKDLPLFIKSVFSKNPFIIISIFTFVFLWLSSGIMIIHRINLKIQNQKPIFKINIIFFLIIYLIINVIFLRGGLQESPLRPADALTTKSNFINNLKLNGIFTILHDSTDTKDFKIYYPIKENIEFTKNFLKNSDSYISEEYPLLRYKKPRKILLPEFKTVETNIELKNKYNFILVLLESWSAKFLKIYGYPQEVTPNLNQFINKGIFFRNFYASGGRSANGIFCILTGLSDRAGRTIFRSNQIFNRFGSLPFLLKEKGYSTIFLHGGDLEFDNLKTALPHLGFDILIGKEEIEKTQKYQRKWSMGFFDEDLYDISFTMMNQIKEPFFMVIFTSNNHHPYTVPEKKFEIFPPTDIEHKFKNSYYYADYALGKFIKRIENSKFINNTIIFLVADHTHHTNLNYLEDRQIPFLVYSPKLLKHKIRYDTSSQLDILPTILSLSGGNTLYSAIGRDLTSEEKYKEYHPFAFFAGGSNTDIIGMIYYPYIAYHYFYSKEKFLFKIDYEISMNNIAKENQKIAEDLQFIIKNLYQFSRYLEKNNIVWPIKEKYLELKKEFIK